MEGGLLDLLGVYLADNLGECLGIHSNNCRILYILRWAASSPTPRQTRQCALHPPLLPAAPPAPASRRGFPPNSKWRMYERSQMTKDMRASSPATSAPFVSCTTTVRSMRFRNTGLLRVLQFHLFSMFYQLRKEIEGQLKMPLLHFLHQPLRRLRTGSPQLL